VVSAGCIAVVDLTGASVRVGVLDAGGRGAHVEQVRSSPWCVAVRLEGDELSVSSGEEASEAGDDPATLLFDRLGEDLPRIGDPELQDLIVKNYWGALWQRPECRDLIAGRRPAFAFAVSPHLYTLPLLARFRRACAGIDDVKLASFAHEAVCLIFGALRSDLFRRETSGEDFSAPATICVVAAREDGVDVACFDYCRASASARRVVVRDFFRADCFSLAARLRSGDSGGALDGLLTLEHPGLSGPAQSALDEALAMLPARRWSARQTTEQVYSLKVEGGAYVARCCLGKADGREEYEVETSYNIGVQCDSEHFVPVVTKEAARRQAHWPRTFNRAFKLHGQSRHETRLNFYGGYSDRVDEAILLGSALLPRGESDTVPGGTLADILVAVSLHSPGSGEITIGLLPDNRAVSNLRFALPGLVV
jgi:hypothetical protein